MSDQTTSTAKALALPPKVVSEIYSKVKGRSAIAKLCGAKPIPFNGMKQFTFSMDGEAAIVGEGAPKPAGDAKQGSKTIIPVKLIYQHRVSDEFLYASEEDKINFLDSFSDGFSKKIARALDIMAFHGVNPATKADASFKATNSFDGIFASKFTEINPAFFDTTLDDAISELVYADKEVTGLAFSALAGTQMGKVTANGIPQYPEFRFGGKPDTFAGYDIDINNTVAFGGSNDMAIIGDFRSAFRWGYAKNMTFEVIEYGNPDGGEYDLKQANEVCLRSEAYVGWGILDEDAFAVITAEADSDDTE